MALPERIGDFRILKLLGEGGMGRVYLAEQDSPQREVALKVLSGASASAEFQRRFQRESELMAGLEHPGIARLYAAGTASTSTGPVPYLAMEFVAGKDLVTHANEARLDLAARLALLAQVCHAVHYAHTRGVIHRDLKPANILVDAANRPRILDFGVAHVAAADGRATLTAAGEVLGTLPYMPIEQLAGTTTAVDPRWDVYALGVIAYELLSGELPYPGLKTATILSAISQVRASAPVRLGKRVPQAEGDVETIVMKAMAGEASQRYGSAAELAADIERFLQRQPIAARPPTMGYVLSLFVRRHKAVTAIATAAALGLIAATIVSLRFAYVANERAAEREAAIGFLENMFAAADPEHALGVDIKLRDVLDVARSGLGSAGLSAPAQVQLQRTLGNSYVGIGLADVGLELLASAHKLEALHTGADSTTARRLELEEIHALKEAGHDRDAEQRLAALIAQLASTPDSELALQARYEEASLQIARGDSAAAEPIARDALTRAEKTLGPEHDVTLALGFARAEALHHVARNDEAIAQSQQVVERLQRRLGPDHPRVQLARDVIALAYREQAKYKESEAIYRETIAARERTIGADHPQTLGGRISLATVMAMDGRAKQAAPIAREAHEGVQKRLGSEAEFTRTVASLRAFVVSEAGDWAESEEINRALVTQDEARPGGVTAEDLVDYNNLANAQKRLGHREEAKHTYETLLAHAEKLVGRDHVHYALFELNYGDCLRELGQMQPARAALAHSVGILQREFGPEHPKTQKAVTLLAALPKT